MIPIIGGNLRNLIDNFSNEKLCKLEKCCRNWDNFEFDKKVENERGKVEIWRKKYDEVMRCSRAWKRDLTLVGDKTIKILSSWRDKNNKMVIVLEEVPYSVFRDGKLRRRRRRREPLKLPRFVIDRAEADASPLLRFYVCHWPDQLWADQNPQH